MSFKEENNFDKRFNESTRILKKYPEKIPIICERHNNSIPKLDRCKFLVPRNLLISEFMFLLRKRLKLTPDKAVYLFIKNNLVSGSEIILKAYDEYSDDDGFLYISYGGESTFG